MKRWLTTVARKWGDRYRRQLFSDATLLLADQTLTLVDVGAAGGLEPRWRPLAAKTSVVAFEPDSRSSTALAEKLSGCASVRIEPFALWSENGPLSFHLCRKPTVSSHYIPNVELMSRFPDVERLDIIRTVTMDARTLDSFELSHCDFIKLDIQGGELEVLRGAKTTLERAFGIEAEVEFVPIYKNQPLFGDVCRFLHEIDLEFIDFVHFAREDREWGNLNFGQCTFGDAIFLRTPESIAENYNQTILSLSDLRRYAGILLIYNRYDQLNKLSMLANRNEYQAKALFEAIDRIVQSASRNWRAKRRVFSLLSFFASLCDREARAVIIY